MNLMLGKMVDQAVRWVDEYRYDRIHRMDAENIYASIVESSPQSALSTSVRREAENYAREVLGSVRFCHG
ncbi:MAG: hypothetical protein J6386_10695 [Candidatus Synoicihabitans palmerolidicus]|nr:hypothetical protein [Candidatus Synoicihabitans palmerolidicus]